MPLTAEELKQITDANNAAIAAAIKPITEGLTQLGGSVKTIGEQLTATNTAVEEIKKAKPTETPTPPKPGDKDKPADTPITPEAIAKLVTDGINAAMKPLNDERAAAATRTKSEQLVRSTLAAKKLGGLLNPKNAATLDRIISTNPADEAAVLASWEKIKAEYTAAGVNADAFASGPEKEDGETTPANAAAAKKAETIKALDAQIGVQNSAAAATPAAK